MIRSPTLDRTDEVLNDEQLAVQLGLSKLDLVEDDGPLTVCDGEYRRDAHDLWRFYRNPERYPE